MISCTPWVIENPAPPMRVAKAAINAQKNPALPCPNGCRTSGDLPPLRTATNSRTSVTVSAAECMASDSIADEPLMRPATSLATPIARLASPATITVTRLSDPGFSISFSDIRSPYVHVFRA
jgi:hypothetical protein